MVFDAQTVHKMERPWRLAGACNRQLVDRSLVGTLLSASKPDLDPEPVHELINLRQVQTALAIDATRQNRLVNAALDRDRVAGFARFEDRSSDH
jgi:hypothetical protein